MFSSTKYTAFPVLALAALLNVTLGPNDDLIGLNCSPIIVIGVGGNLCGENPVCCRETLFVCMISLGWDKLD